MCLYSGLGLVGGAEAPLVHSVEAAGRRAFQRTTATTRQAAAARGPARHRLSSALLRDARRELAASGLRRPPATAAPRRCRRRRRRRRARLQRIRDRRAQPQAEALEEQDPRVRAFRFELCNLQHTQLMTHTHSLGCNNIGAPPQQVVLLLLRFVHTEMTHALSSRDF